MCAIVNAARTFPRYLGRFREIFRAGQAQWLCLWPREGKICVELGNDLSRARPPSLPCLLCRKRCRCSCGRPAPADQQYRRREPVYKGAGDIICCLDESGSTAGDLAAWGKAVALTLLEIAQSEGRKFALVHFSGPGRFQTDVFLPGQSSLEEKPARGGNLLGRRHGFSNAACGGGTPYAGGRL